MDIEPQPNYPFEFHQADALAWDDFEEFDVIHASPPCQSFTAYRRKGHGVGDGYLNLIPQMRERLIATGKPFVIENVEYAREHLVDPIRLCGSSFNLDVRRHRLFEVHGIPGRPSAPPCDHAWQTPRFPQATNRKNKRRTVEVGSYRCHKLAAKAMGIDWMTNAELSQAIPPAYTKWLGGTIIWALSKLDDRAERGAS